jgi:hypothetical protein
MPYVAFVVNNFICEMDFAGGREDDVFGLSERSHHKNSDAGGDETVDWLPGKKMPESARLARYLPLQRQVLGL